MKRRKAREEAVCMVFETDFNNSDDIDNMIEVAMDVREIEKDDYLISAVKGVMENKKEIDETIEKYLKDWKIERLSKVSLAIMRVACYEILFRDEIPESVSINEAVEIAKAYESEEAASFINGLLGSIVRGKTS